MLGADPTIPLPTCRPPTSATYDRDYDFLPETTHFLQWNSRMRAGFVIEFLRERNLV